jgi:hypothetical protein
MQKERPSGIFTAAGLDFPFWGEYTYNDIGRVLQGAAERLHT